LCLKETLQVTTSIHLATPTNFIAGPLGGIARAKPEIVYVREFIMIQYFRQSIGTQSSANFILTCPACPLAHLHMIIHGFAFWKFAKPAHEHHLQVLPARASLVLYHLPGLKSNAT
jgi:hypothetical protein